LVAAGVDLGALRTPILGTITELKAVDLMA